jgi:hypothetical protein
MSAATARIVLADRKLRWSSPILFNDPFDVPREMYISNELSVECGKKIVRILPLAANIDNLFSGR